eukprot:TRINITY_DN24288_c0_g1_i1.p1 TRINITY_DN24288_c0_g1~~TRINITY_DN24288_c0_g1_i1.p1  ORF type:complete len:203 (-),score=53.88 TRINITY_DN24288_c0_g1_i1:74-682(-)
MITSTLKYNAPRFSVHTSRRCFHATRRLNMEDLKDSRIKDLEGKIAELRAKLDTTLGEVENVKRRMTKDVHKAQEFGVDKLVKNLFSITDTLNICLQNKPDFESPQFKDNVQARVAFESIEATKKQFASVFKDSYEIEELVPPIGAQFNPMEHNALFEVDTPVDPNGNPIGKPGQIGMVVKTGWKRKDVLLRPASVGTIKRA